jgi:hypothetical protein
MTLDSRPFAPMKKVNVAHSARESCNMEVFVVSEPLYDICESWAEEPEPEMWDAVYPVAMAWLIRPN